MSRRNKMRGLVPKLIMLICLLHINYRPFDPCERVLTFIFSPPPCSFSRLKELGPIPTGKKCKMEQGISGISKKDNLDGSTEIFETNLRRSSVPFDFEPEFSDIFGRMERAPLLSMGCLLHLRLIFVTFVVSITFRVNFYYIYGWYYI